MANLEINDLTNKAIVDTTDEFAIQETGGGSTRKTPVTGLRVTKSQVTDLVNSYGWLYEDNDAGTAITLTSAGTYYGWKSATEGEVAGAGYVTSDVADVTADHLTIGASGAGYYEVTVAASFLIASGSTIKGYLFNTGVRINVGFEQENQNAGSVIHSCSASGILSLSNTDELSMRFTSDKGSDSITVYRAHISIRRLAA